MKVILNRVPYYSQLRDVATVEWRMRACTITCLKMATEGVLAYQERLSLIPSIDELFAEGEKIEATMLLQHKTTKQALSSGKLHDTVIKLAHNHGVLAHPEEYRSRSVDMTTGGSSTSEFEKRMVNYGIRRIFQSIANKSPVIVSIRRGFVEGGSPHSILIMGSEDGSGFYYFDPESHFEEMEIVKTPPFISIESFRQSWRQLAIFVDALP